MMSSEPMFLEGIAEFNRHRFFEAHEVWEDLWRGHRDDDRTFLQGLIQVAAGCYHLQTDNLSGALSLLLKGQAKLRRYGSAHAGIDLDGLMSRCDALAGCVAEIRRGEGSVIDDHLIPTIAFLTADHVSAHVKTVDPEGDRSWRQ
jgi:uncharacterized protein